MDKRLLQEQKGVSFATPHKADMQNLLLFWIGMVNEWYLK